MENQQENQYLLTRPVGKLLSQFAIPSVVGLVISCLYNIVDQIFVGNGVGYLGNAATGIIFPITVIGWGFSVLFGDGAATYISIAQGKGDTSGAGKAVANSMLGSFLSGLVIIAVCYALGDNILYGLGATEASITLARDYGNIIFLMMPLALVQNTLASIIRADGSPRYSMAAMITGCVINLIGDPVAIYGLGWGIKGAAAATILGQFVSFVMCAAYLARSRVFRVRAADFVPSWPHLSQVLPLGGGSFLTQLSIVLVTVVNNKLLVSYGAESAYGSDIPLAAFVVIMKLFQIVLNIACGIAAGALPIIGCNYGAQQYGRVKETFKLVALWTLGVCAVATVLFEAAPLAFIRLFGADGELYTTFAVSCLRIYLSLIILTCIQKACAMFLQSIGRVKAAIPLSILRDVVFLMLFSLTFPRLVGVTGIFWAAPAADLCAMAITVVVMVKVWRGMKEPASFTRTAEAG